MASNDKSRIKYGMLAVTSILVAIAVLDRISIIYRIFGKVDIATGSAIIALVLQVYFYYLGAIDSQTKDLEKKLRVQLTLISLITLVPKQYKNGTSYVKHD